VLHEIGFLLKICRFECRYVQVWIIAKNESRTQSTDSSKACSKSRVINNTVVLNRRGRTHPRGASINFQVGRDPLRALQHERFDY